MARISYSLYLCLIANLAAALNRCYYPNSKEAVDDYPCDPEAEYGPCCGAGSMCLSNRSCKGPGRTMIRGSCTDQAWGSLECPLYCYLAPNLGPDLISCSNVTKTDTSFCCDGATDCCDTGNGRIEVLPANPEPWATWDSTMSRFNVVKALSTASSSTSTTTGDAATSTPTTDTSPESTTSTTASASDPAETALDRSSESDQAQASGLSTGAQAGIGVGAAVAAILLGVIAYLLWRLRNKKAPGPPPGMHEQTPGQHSPEEMYAYYHPAEMPAEQRWHIKPEQQRIGELDGYWQPAEMPAARM